LKNENKRKVNGNKVSTLEEESLEVIGTLKVNEERPGSEEMKEQSYTLMTKMKSRKTTCWMTNGKTYPALRRNLR
jgi:hypothetical protein